MHRWLYTNNHILVLWVLHAGDIPTCDVWQNPLYTRSLCLSTSGRAGCLANSIHNLLYTPCFLEVLSAALAKAAHCKPVQADLAPIQDLQQSTHFSAV